MSKQNRKSLERPRKRAYLRQSGRCCYCKQPMWLKNLNQYAQQYCLTINRARQMQCTGEHLIAHKDGGSAGNENIAAACKYCNEHRHRRKKALNPTEFGHYVLRRLKKGRWHGLTLT